MLKFLTGGVLNNIAANPQNNERWTDCESGTLLKNAKIYH